MSLPETTPVSSATMRPASSVRWWAIAPTLLVIWVVGMVDKIGVAVISTNKQFLNEMHLVGQNALIGSMTSALLFSYGIGFFIWGWLTDRFGPRRCAVIGLTGWGISTLIAALATNVTVLIISRALLGLCEAVLWPVSNALTARWFPQSERGRAKSVWINGTNVGPAIAGFLVTGLISAFQWRGVFWFLTGAAAVICIPLVLGLVRDYPLADKRVSDSERAYIQQGQVLISPAHEPEKVYKKPSFWLVVLAYVVNVMGVFGLATWFPSYLALAKHMSPQATSSYMLLAYGLALILTIWIGAHTDRTHKKAVWIGCGFALSAVFLFLGAEAASPVADALFVAVALTSLQAFTLPTIHGVMHSAVSANEMGTYTGILAGFANMFAAFGPTVMGALITLGGGSYVFAFGFLVLFFIFGSVMGFLLVRQGY
ncbi:MAG: MFS transporter [Thermoflavifilum sp.]|nr:MFS transporter [Thermoflavifilum sp.]MCL6513828.1 MFS transporter [Alicyclobacillus sp.]